MIKIKKYGLYFLVVGLYAVYAVLNGASYADEYTGIRKKAEQGNANAKEGLQSEAQSRYRKIAADGKVLADNAQQWSCVSDEETGLMWEVKTEDGLHNKDKEYRWGGKGKRYADWDVLVDGTNSEALCGHSDWRVPRLYELASLVYCSNGVYDLGDGCRGKNRRDRDDYDRPTIHTAYFPDTGKEWEWYWSSSSYDDDGESGFLISFIHGHISNDYSHIKYRVRLVRGRL